VIWRRLPAEQRAVPVRFVATDEGWSVVAGAPDVESNMADALTTEFGGTGARFTGEPVSGLTPQLMRTTVRLNVRERPDADAGFGLVVPQDTVVVALRGDLDGQPSDGTSDEEDAWAHFVVSREARGWAKSTYLTAYDGCVAIPRRLVAAHADAAAAIRTSFRLAATHISSPCTRCATTASPATRCGRTPSKATSTSTS
jgi:hypothetical protein